jgi:hypothetical protein
MIKAAFARAGANLKLARRMATAAMGSTIRSAGKAAKGPMRTGASYLRWGAAGAAAGGIANMGSNIVDSGNPNKPSLMKSMGAGAMAGLGYRGARGAIRGAAARRRSRVGGA